MSAVNDFRRAITLMDNHQHAAALLLLKASLRQSEQKPGGASSAETADILGLIGGCYAAQNNCRAAAEHLRRAATVSNYAFISRIRASLAAAASFSSADDYAEVEKQTVSSLSLLDVEAATGATAPVLMKGFRAEALMLSAKSLVAAGRFSEALPPFEENLTYYESIGHTEMSIFCLTGLGVIYFHQGFTEKALAVAQRAQSLNPRRVESLYDLGELWSRLERYDHALQCAQEALKREEKAEGKHSGNYALLLQRMGATYSDLGQPDVALSWHCRARTVYEKLNMTDSMCFGSLLTSIGTVFDQLGNLSEALLHFTRAEKVYRGVLPPDHPSLTNCMRNISIVNAKLGNVVAAAAAAASFDSTARRSQVQCAAEDCPRKVKADGTPLDQCGVCKRCYYCTKACQAADWKAGHKAECKELRGGK